MPLASVGFWFGLGLTLCFVPGLTGYSVLTGWPFLAATLPFSLFHHTSVTPIHWLGAFFLSYASLSLLWTDNIFDGLGMMAQWIILGMGFYYGSVASSPRSVYLGICCGLSVSVGLAVFQSLGYEWVYADGDFRTNATGLFVNSTVFGTILALSLIPAIFSQIWWYVPIGGLGLILSGARAAGCAAVTTVLIGLWGWNRRLMLMLTIPAILFAAAVWLNKPTGTRDTSLELRSAYWADTGEALSALGHGVGSFFQLYPTIAKRTDPVKVRPEHPYSDFLELLFEFGLGTLLLWAMLILAWEIKLETERYILLCFCLLGLTYWPLAIPVTAFMVAFATGSLARGWAVVRDGGSISRPNIPYWLGQSGHPYA